MAHHIIHSKYTQAWKDMQSRPPLNTIQAGFTFREDTIGALSEPNVKKISAIDHMALGCSTCFWRQSIQFSYSATSKTQHWPEDINTHSVFCASRRDLCQSVPKMLFLWEVLDIHLHKNWKKDCGIRWCRYHCFWKWKSVQVHIEEPNDIIFLLIREAIGWWENSIWDLR